MKAHRILMIDTIFPWSFMISTLSMSRHSGVPVNLPKAATGQQPASESAAVTITPDGKVSSIAGVPREHPHRAPTAAGGESELLVLINADERVEHGRVVDVMDDARQAGSQNGHRRQTQGQPAVRDDSLSHLYCLLLHSRCGDYSRVIILKHTVSLRRQDFLPIGLVDVPRKEQPKPIEK